MKSKRILPQNSFFRQPENEKPAWKHWKKTSSERQCVFYEDKPYRFTFARGFMIEGSFMHKQLPIEAKDIQKLIPHRFPFMLLDRIVAFESGKSLKAIKNITMNEPQFMGHFPDFPVMPGVLIIEAMAQACGALAILTEGGRSEDEIYFFAGIDNARFKKQVIPGDQLVFDIELLQSKRGIGKFQARAFVADELAVEAEIMCAKRKVGL